MTDYVPAILFILSIALRIPFVSKMLYHHDSVNFALALHDYDLRLHQPHPPGYFLYVMLGRFLHLFIADENLVLITISIIFTSLTVVFVYLLADLMYNFRTALVASLVALVSPNLWFHGEVALSYGVEAFFSAATGYFCWMVYKGRHDLVFVSALLLGVAGGFRPTTCLFLLPLWLLAVWKCSPRRVLGGVATISVLCGVSLLLSIRMTGGMGSFTEAFSSLWQTNTGHNSVFDKGWQNALLFGKTLFAFSLYSLGAGVAAMATALYAAIRTGEGPFICQGKVAFYLAWLLPPFLFYQFIFIHPANPGYFLILLPPLLMLCGRGIVRTGEILEGVSGRRLTAVLTLAVMVCNGWIFLGSASPVSRTILQRHDRDLAKIVRELGSFDPQTTAIVLKPSIFYGFRMIMYYLPQYYVYNLDPRALGGPGNFSGAGRRTMLTRGLVLPGNLQKVVTLRFGDRGGEGGRRVEGLTRAWISSGPAIEMIREMSAKSGI